MIYLIVSYVLKKKWINEREKIIFLSKYSLSSIINDKNKLSKDKNRKK